MDPDHALLKDTDRLATRPAWPSAWLGPWLGWLDRALHREILRLRARYELSMDELRGLYVSDEQVDQLVLRRAVEPADAARIATLDAGLESMLAEARLAPSPLHDVTDRFRLTDVDVLAVVLCLAPEVDLSYQSVFAYLNDDVTRRLPTVDLCQRLSGGALEPGSAAVVEGLVEVHRHPAAPLWRSAGMVLADPVRRFLLSRRGAPVPALAAPASSLTVLAARLPQDAAAEADAWAARLGRRLVRAGSAAEPAMRLREAVLEARLLDGALHVVGEDEGVCDDPASPDVRRLLRTLAEAPVPVLLTVPPEVVDRLPLEGLDHERAELGQLDVAGRSQLWTEELLRHGLTPTPGDVDEVAVVFRLSGAQIRVAAAAASRAGTASLPVLTRAARSGSTSALAGVAQRVQADYSWDDLVLPKHTLVRLHELAGAIRHRDEVFGDWSFGRLVGGHTSVRALFSGPSGTGKTMSASVLGRELGVEVFRVDLAAVVSKYIGETEKNLDRILSAAERSNAIVLFDEADALFGKRSDVKDAHDRYANIEVAFLLQRLEVFDGIAVLATNLAGNLDEAFSRRLHFHIEFPPPDEAARLRLWRRAFPRSAPLADDLDPDFLAAMLPLTGGEIRSAALLAAFLAAHERTTIEMRHVVRSLARLRRQQGKLPSSAEFKGFLRIAQDEDG